MQKSLTRSFYLLKVSDNQAVLSERVFCLMLFFVCFSFGPGLFAQTKKADKVSSQRSLSNKPLDTGTKKKKFEELSDFVIVDYRANAIADVVDNEGVSVLKKDMEEMFPLHTVFATSDLNVCVIGVQSTADAKTVFSKTSPKKSRIAKRDNLGKMLAEKNVKLITKEK